MIGPRLSPIKRSVPIHKITGVVLEREPCCIKERRAFGQSGTEEKSPAEGNGTEDAEDFCFEKKRGFIGSSFWLMLLQFCFMDMIVQCIPISGFVFGKRKKKKICFLSMKR